jgi:hypothetical protein
MVWKGEVACLLGLAALLLLCIVGLTSLPSVSATLNWAEWRFVQSKLGMLALLLAAGHVVAMGSPHWVSAGWRIFKSISFLSLLLPAFTLLLRLILALPPLGTQLNNIRNGWERVSSNSSSKNTAAGNDVKIDSTSSSTCSTSCSSRKGILKAGCGSSKNANGKKKFSPIYTAVKMNGEGDDDGEEEERRELEKEGVGMLEGLGGCVGCQESVVHQTSLPSRGCQCSNV